MCHSNTNRLIAYYRRQNSIRGGYVTRFGGEAKEFYYLTVVGAGHMVWHYYGTLPV